MSERFVMDDCGTLIDMESRTTYDYVSEVCPVLNKQEDEIKRLKKMNNELIEIIHGISRESAETISKLWTGDVE